MNRARGLSLLELLVVVALIATLAGLGAMVVGRALPGQQLRGAARELAAELRFTRAQAIATGSEQVFRLDVDSRRWDAAGKRSGELPAGIEIIATSARQEQPAQREAAVRFFPEGAATGARFVLRRDDADWRVDVAWLTGEVTLARGEGTP
ncbi:type II secretion system protein XpsH [Arenimonas caeni]|uniref:Type II secretion system protein H n=1 Tax=Arenimonas caeni TaxID=2058085 RepID=A0A2P6MC29_9GAMM|nr:GspH/FimT family protein [Arenimonas caeni]PRH83545.1 type II secretion system protein GspH [Arenimonas caeni]